MKLYYYKDKKGNFGDDLNIWLGNRLLPDFFDDNEEAIFIGIGTLLNSLLPTSPFKVVFSSGVGYKNPPPSIDGSWKIYCVRGPLSADRLGVDRKHAITDGAALLRSFDFDYQEKCHDVSFVPHHQSHRPKWKNFCDKIGLNYIDPSNSVDSVFTEIRKSKLVIAESMHGAIVADIFRVPWIPVKLHQHILDFKWHDWCASMNLKYNPVTLPFYLKPEYNNKYYIRLKYVLLSFALKRIAKRREPLLSSNEVLDSATTKLYEKLNELKKDYGIPK
jgi:succinoglycan biosynthesis protein ExoV